MIILVTVSGSRNPIHPGTQMPAEFLGFKDPGPEGNLSGLVDVCPWQT
jgi:hypothetical protein